MTAIAKKVAELFGKPGTVKETPLTAVPSQNVVAIPTNDFHSSYREAAESVLSDCLAIDANWLSDHRPALWRRLCFLDHQASEFERRGETGNDYRRVLERIVATVKEARELYKSEVRKETLR